MPQRRLLQPAAVAALAIAAAVAGGAAAQDKKKAPARAETVTVQVLMLTDRHARHPEEYIEVAGKRYIYFDSPRLAVPARPLNEPKPRYPKGKFEQRDGAVILQLLIDEQGTVERSDVVCSAPPFEKSALEAVKGLKFRPAQDKSGPVRSYLLVEFGYGRGYPCARLPD
ncbi:MAG TPA: TonB family protein [Burkholderiales bacterium]|nr:TonB family protein [Burkholderiales bacterium]